MPKKQPTNTGETRGRKPLAKAHKRSRKVLASFTSAQRAQLEAEARARGLRVAELVALRALGGE